MRRIVNGVAGIATLLYPFVVWLGSQYLEPWQMAGILMAVLWLRFIGGSSAKHWGTPILLLGSVYFGFVLWSNELAALRFYPLLMNVIMLSLFGWSLWTPPSLIERLARLQHPNLPPEGVIYTRHVTQVWCGFFIINGTLAGITAVWASLEVWSLYNGLIAYVLMGALMGGEYLVRLRTQKHVR